MSPNNVAVVSLSIGRRPWFKYVLKWMRIYADRHQYDLKIIDKPLAQINIDNFDSYRNYGCFNKLYIGTLLDDYERIIYFDDTCMISPLLEPLVKLVPDEYLGCWVEGVMGDKDYTTYLQEHKRIYSLDEPMPREMFFNSGVMVLSRAHKALFKNISIDRRMLKDSKFNDQGYLSLRAFEESLPLMDIGKWRNFVGSKLRRALKDSKFNYGLIKVAHLTGVLSSKERVALAVAFDDYFEQLSRLNNIKM